MHCKYCGKWSGLFNNEHLDCAVAAKMPPSPSSAPSGTVTPGTWNVPQGQSGLQAIQHQASLTFGQVVRAVIVGKLLTSVIVLIIAALVRLLFY